MNHLVSKTRISVLLAGYSVSGVPRIQLNIVNCLVKKGYLVDLVLITNTLPEKERVALPQSVRIVEFKKKRVSAGLLFLARYFHQIQPSAVISAEEHLNLVAIAARKLSRLTIPISISMHVPPSLEASKPLWRKGRWVSILAHWLYPRADAIVAISSVMADSLAEVTRLPRTSIRVIHNPVVDDALFMKADLPPSPVIGTLNEPFILGVGSLHKRKGFLDLIDAFANLYAERKMRLVILGEGPQRPVLEARISELGLEDDVYLLGAVENPYAWMSRAQLFVLASYFEGLPTVLIEAMACGCPVVSTDCPTGPSEILKDGQFGELVPLRNPETLANAMTRTLDNPLNPETLKSRALDFHVNKIVDKYLDVLGVHG